MLRVAMVNVCLAVLLNGAVRRPEFQDYPPDGGFGGPPAEPQLTTAWSQQYRTRIRRGAASREGFRRGFEYVETAGPNFAGHYRVVNWGCGAGCLMMVVVDLETGTIYPPPMSTGAIGEAQVTVPNLGTGWGDFDFRADSRLFIMKTCPWGSQPEVAVVPRAWVLWHVVLRNRASGLSASPARGRGIVAVTGVTRIQVVGRRRHSTTVRRSTAWIR
jgi:hypothetical protein